MKVISKNGRLQLISDSNQCIVECDDTDDELEINYLKYIYNKVMEEVIEERKQKDDISFETVMSLDIRVCKIVSAERVPKKDKLLKLELDTGIDVRTAITNIGDAFEPEDIQGKKAPFILNLKPMKMAGIESRAMIMISEDSDGKHFPEITQKVGSVYL